MTPRSEPPKEFVEAWLVNAGVRREHELLKGQRPTPNIAYWTMREVVNDWNSDEGHFWRASRRAALKDAAKVVREISFAAIEAME